MNWNYISGFFDADGSISYVVNTKNKPKIPQISFHNCKLEILEQIKDFIQTDLGIKGFITVKKSYKENHNTAYDLKYSHLPKCLLLSTKLKSYHPSKIMRLKSLPVVKEMTPRNGKYSKTLLEKRTTYIDQLLTDQAR
jgi:hypothetical protein